MPPTLRIGLQNGTGYITYLTISNYKRLNHVFSGDSFLFSNKGGSTIRGYMLLLLQPRVGYYFRRERLIYQD